MSRFRYWLLRFSPPARRRRGPVTLYDRDGLHIWAEVTEEGALLISGQDLKPGLGWNEYEYWYTVPSEDLPLIRAALDGTENDNVLVLLAANAERIMPMEKAWLDATGARYEFWNRIEPDR
jgi:hypothetical protein